MLESKREVISPPAGVPVRSRKLIFVLGPRHDDEFRELDHVLPAFPSFKLIECVRPDQEEQSIARMKLSSEPLQASTV